MITRSTTAALPALPSCRASRRQGKSAVDAIVASAWAAAGTVTGVGETIKAWTNDVRIAAVEPYESQALGGGLTGPHGISDLGYGFMPENFNSYVVDNVVRRGHHRRAAGRATGAAHRCHPRFGGIRCRLAGGRTAHPL